MSTTVPASRPLLVGLLLTAVVATALLPAPSHGARKTPTRLAGWSTSALSLAVGEEVDRTVTVRTGRRTPPRAVLLQFRPAEQRRWRTVVRTTSAADGEAEVRGALPGSGWLRVTVPATPTAARAATARTRVTVLDAGNGDPIDPGDPSDPGDPGDPGWTASAFEAEVLRLTNQLRATGTTCGSRSYGPRPALTPNGRLGRAARQYARRMGEERFFSHVSPSGDGPGDRAEAAGYEWSSYGENIAAGYATPADVVEGWHESVGHCHNLMGSFEHLGVGFADVGGSRYGEYWVQLFGRPRG